LEDASEAKEAALLGSAVALLWRDKERGRSGSHPARCCTWRRHDDGMSESPRQRYAVNAQGRLAPLDWWLKVHERDVTQSCGATCEPCKDSERSCQAREARVFAMRKLNGKKPRETEHRLGVGYNTVIGRNEPAGFETRRARSSQSEGPCSAPSATFAFQSLSQPIRSYAAAVTARVGEGRDGLGIESARKGCDAVVWGDALEGVGA
jgi:hypothetical protein